MEPRWEIVADLVKRVEALEADMREFVLPPEVQRAKGKKEPAKK